MAYEACRTKGCNTLVEKPGYCLACQQAHLDAFERAAKAIKMDSNCTHRSSPKQCTCLQDRTKQYRAKIRALTADLE
jgi:hypothetical protein